MPLKLFSKKSDRLDMPYVRPSLELVRTTSIESIDSNATAPNNRGPGRNLGRLYDALGSKIEDMMNRRAKRLNRGPIAVAKEIRALRRYEEASVENGGVAILLPPTVEDYCTLKKLCRRLLKYCRSHLLETQLRALEEVTALATEDLYAREAFSELLHDSYLAPKYKETELRVASVKAVISIKDNEVHEFWSYYSSPSYGYGTGHENQLKMYLSDPDVSFLVVRLLRVELEKTVIFHSYDDAWNCYVEVASRNPQMVEHESMCKLIELVPSNFIYENANSMIRLAHDFPILSIFTALRRPPFLYGRDGEVNFDFGKVEDKSAWIVGFLKNLCDSKDLAAQLWYLRCLDDDTKLLLQETMLGSEVLIAYARVYSGTELWLSPLRSTRGKEAYLAEAAVMLFYYFRGTPTEQTLAKLLLSRSIEQSRYFKVALCGLLRQIGDSTQFEPPSIFRERCLMPAPSFDDQFFIKREWIQGSNYILPEEVGDMHENDTLFCSGGLFLWLEVSGDKRPFDATSHFPILAGYDAGGKELYVAQVTINKYDAYEEQSFFTYVADGADCVSFIDGEGEKKTTREFEVLVLRHDPSDVAMHAIPEGASFQTGSAYWVYDEDNYSDSELDSALHRDLDEI